MSLEDFLRLYLGQIVAVILFIFITVFVTARVKRYAPTDEKEKINKIRNVILWIILVGFGIYLFYSSSVNLTPRKVIDRNEVNKQQQDFEQRHTK